MRTIARASDSQSVRILYRAGAEKVINPIIAGAAAIARASIKPTVANFLELVNISRDLDIDFDSLHIMPGSPLIGKSLAGSPLRSEYNYLLLLPIFYLFAHVRAQCPQFAHLYGGIRNIQYVGNHHGYDFRFFVPLRASLEYLP